MTQPPAPPPGQLQRRLGLGGAVGIGLASMIGAGVFVVFAPAAAAAGRWLLVSLLLAAVIAAANAHSSARLAMRHPLAGGTYVYGREQLGVPWGHLAGWAFIVGKTASCAAMALAIGVHVWPGSAKVVAIVAVLAVLALNLQGIHRSACLALITTLGVLALLVTFVVVMLTSPPGTAGEALHELPDAGGVRGIAQGAGLLFFAFAGYARIATLGEEVRDPRRTLPWAIGLSLGIVLALYLLIAFALIQGLGVGWLAARQAPLAEAAEISGWPWLGPALRVAALVAVGGALLTLSLGVSRTVLALARDKHLPPYFSVIEPTHGAPRRAEVLIAGLVIVLVLVSDLSEAIGISSFCVLVYYAIANLSAWTLAPGVLARVVPVVGLLGCLGVALLLPWPAVATGTVILAMGAFIGWARHTTRE